MSTESSAVSRPPQTDSAPDGRGSETPVSDFTQTTDLSELPSPSEKVTEFLEAFGERAHTPLSTEHGRELRPECVEEETEVRSFTTEEGDTVRVEDVTERRAVPVYQAVAEMLEWHEDYHKSTLRLEYGTEADPTHELLDVDLENSWFAAYQDRERAKLKALERETCGYETCEECETRYCADLDEHETEYVPGRFTEPVVVLTGRTASGAGRPPVDHARGIADAWTDGEVRRSLRYITDEKLGLDSEDWVRWTQGEPHPGEGENRGYHHAHDAIIVDAAAADGEVTPATFRTLIEAHVSECEHAGREAHDLDRPVEDWEAGEVETVSVKEVDGEINESVASYVASYLANEKVDLLERPPEYLHWAATMWATNTQKGIRTDSANEAIAADGCRHKHYEGEQGRAHGEKVTRESCRCAETPWGPGCRRCDGRGFHVVCFDCMSRWDIEQKETLVEAKQIAGPGEPSAEVVADGGADEGEETPEQQREEELRDLWGDARGVESVGSEPVERPVAGRESGDELEGREVPLGGGEDWCAACHTVEPEGECTATSYKHAEYEGRCPLPPEHFGEHSIVEGREDAERTVTTGSEQYRGDGHIPFVYESEPSRESVSVEFERPPTWRAKAIIRDGEKVPATGGSTTKKPLDLPSAPERVVSMAAEYWGRAWCCECDTEFVSPGAYVEHGCEGRVRVEYLQARRERPEVTCTRCGYSWRSSPKAGTSTCPICAECEERYSWVESAPVVGVPDRGRDTPAAETVLSYEEFAEVTPERLLSEHVLEDDTEGETELELGEHVKEYIRNNSPSVPEVLGRFALPPSAAVEVEERLV